MYFTKYFTNLINLLLPGGPVEKEENKIFISFMARVFLKAFK